jgi:hypothetical protein
MDRMPQLIVRLLKTDHDGITRFVTRGLLFARGRHSESPP